jgi:hypothetical protein
MHFFIPKVLRAIRMAPKGHVATLCTLRAIIADTRETVVVRMPCAISFRSASLAPCQGWERTVAAMRCPRSRGQYRRHHHNSNRTRTWMSALIS